MNHIICILIKYLGSFLVGVIIMAFFFGFDYEAFESYNKVGVKAWFGNIVVMMTFLLGYSLFSWFVFIVLYRQIRNQNWWVHAVSGLFSGMSCFAVLNLDEIQKGTGLDMRIMLFCGIAGLIYMMCLKLLLKRPEPRGSGPEAGNEQAEEGDSI